MSVVYIQATGDAIADMMFYGAPPARRLPFDWPRFISQVCFVAVPASLNCTAVLCRIAYEAVTTDNTHAGSTLGTVTVSWWSVTWSNC